MLIPIGWQIFLFDPKVDPKELRTRLWTLYKLLETVTVFISYLLYERPLGLIVGKVTYLAKSSAQPKLVVSKLFSFAFESSPLWIHNSFPGPVVSIMVSWVALRARLVIANFFVISRFVFKQWSTVTGKQAVIRNVTFWMERIKQKDCFYAGSITLTPCLTHALGLLPVHNLYLNRFLSV